MYYTFKQVYWNQIMVIWYGSSDDDNDRKLRKLSLYELIKALPYGNVLVN